MVRWRRAVFTNFLIDQPACTSIHLLTARAANTIDSLNLFLRGWSNLLRTGNASEKFLQMDW